PLYFDDALEVYDRIKFEHRIYGVGLVNTNKIKEYDKYLPNSLAEKVDSNHPYARNYANMLLGSIIGVKKLEDLKMHSRSITQSAMTYINHTARQINPRIYETPYIGSGATEMQINLDTKLLSEQKEDIDRNSKVLNDVSRSLSLIKDSKIPNILQTNQGRYFELVKQTRKEYIELEEKLNDLQGEAALTKLDIKLDEERNKKRQLKLEYDQLNSNMADLRSEKTRILEEIEDVRDNLDTYKDELNKWQSNYPELIPNAQSQFNALKQRYNYNYDLISRNLIESTTQIKTENAKAENEVINLMRNYINNYHFGAAPSLDELIHFERESNLIRENNLIQYEQEAIDLRKASETGFKEEFVGKLRASIESAQIQIEELNLALEGKTFGQDSYELITGPSFDPQFKQYYDIIMSSDAVFKHTLFTENLSRKHEVILMELFNKIASFDPEDDKFALQYLDYRYYMSYDIRITSSNGNISHFSKVSREKSGGETQVPFYIVIAASFQQLLSKNKRIDSGCVVLFDEAFNNMDESRIDAMMKFYNSLSIQLLIAVPPQRVSNIVNYVNTSLAIIKEDDFAIVQAFNRDQY
ncbi:MAG: SbcC/MukB-like Walker B domain-containing protein, partial [Acholeplasmataceae bacterium]